MSAINRFERFDERNTALPDEGLPEGVLSFPTGVVSFPLAWAPTADVFPLTLRDLEGRLCEFSSVGVQGNASVASRYVWEAQRTGAWPVWISTMGLPYVEDLEAMGIDSHVLPVIAASDTHRALHAAERVIRSGVCGVVVVDVGSEANVALATMGRLLQLAQRHATACVFLTERDDQHVSLSPLISLRVQCAYERHAVVLPHDGEAPVTLGLHIVRDKRKGVQRTYEAPCYGVDGLF